MSKTKKLMIFELWYGGHYAFWIKHILNQASCQDRFDEIFVVVSQRFMEMHADIIEWANINCPFASFYCVDEHEQIFTRSKNYSKSFVVRKYYQLLSYWTNRLLPDTCLLTDFGPFQFAFALRLPIGTKTQFSGVHFRPTFHYKSVFGENLQWVETLRALRQRYMLRLALRSPRLKTIFFLDQYAVKNLAAKRETEKLIFLPDPVDLVSENSELRRRLEYELRIDSGRKKFLLFGALSARKGIIETLDAVALLDPDVAQQVAIIFTGMILQRDRSTFLNKLATVRQKSMAQIIVIERFISDDEAIELFNYSNVILAPYNRHVGMSGILLRAAAAGKPIISSDFGLLGKITRDRKLGVTVDSQTPQCLADAIAMLSQDLKEGPNMYDVSEMKKLVEEHSIKKFAETLYSHL